MQKFFYDVILLLNRKKLKVESRAMTVTFTVQCNLIFSFPDSAEFNLTQFQKSLSLT